MNTNIVEVRKNILIKTQITTNTSFTKVINDVNFIPDEMIVRMITYNSVAALPSGDSANDPGLAADPYNRIANIYTDLISGDFWLGSFTDVGNSTPGTRFQIKRPIGGTYTFKIMNVNDELSPYSCDLAIHVEFVKYREVKETVYDGGLVSVSGKSLQKIY